jgi:hypothetical protein
MASSLGHAASPRGNCASRANPLDCWSGILRLASVLDVEELPATEAHTLAFERL